MIEIGYTAESVCTGGSVLSWCQITVFVDGLPVGDDDFAFDSGDSGAEGGGSWEGHAMTRVTAELPAGTYLVTASSGQTGGTPTFRLDEQVLTAEVHLTS